MELFCVVPHWGCVQQKLYATAHETLPRRPAWGCVQKTTVCPYPRNPSAPSCAGLCATTQLYAIAHGTLLRRPARGCVQQHNCMVCHCPWNSSAPSRAGLSQTNRNYTQCMIFCIPLTAAVSPPVPPAGPCSGAESAHGLRQRAGRRIFAVPP